MDIIRAAIHRPVGVVVGMLLIVMFGLIGLRAIPVQLTPTVDRPIVTISTSWPGRSPEEVVDSITREQEERLKNVQGLKRMRSVSREGSSDITLEFYIGSDIDRALQEVSDALRQVPDYPDEVDEPIIEAAEGSSESAIAWIIVDLDPARAAAHPGFDITTLFDPLDKEVKPLLERIEGVAEVNVYGGREREVRVLLDATRLAQRGLNWIDVIEALRAENRNASAGTIAEGKRDYRVRVVGQFLTEADVLGTIVAYRPGADGVLRPVYVRDLGTVEFGHEKPRGFVRALGERSIAINVIRQSDANVVDIMEQVRRVLREEISGVDPATGEKTGVLHKLAGDAGPDLRIRQVYDETVYIDAAIDLVRENVVAGGLLAVLVLLLFLRSFASTGVVAVAIPVSIIGTFIVLQLLGRTLNVISLAGLAFSVGMGIDNAIVVLENIYRRRQLGDPPLRAAYRGAKEVWGAILASTLTNVAVFLPVITMQEEAGQLFKDISLAATASVAISLLVAVTVVPAAAARLLRASERRRPRGPLRTAWEDLFGLATLCARGAASFARSLHWLMTGWRAWSLRPAVVVLLTIASLAGAWLLTPPLDYLPTGNQNLVFGGLLIPPGYSLEQQEQIAQRVEAQVAPYMNLEERGAAHRATLPPIVNPFGPRGPIRFEPVGVENFFIGAFGGGMFCGATSEDPEKVIPIGTLLTNAMMGIPDAFGGASQASIFGRGVGGGNTVNLEISGPDLARVTAAAGYLYAQAGQRYGFGVSVTPDPSNFNLTQPEWRVSVNRHGRELGLTSRDVGTAVRALFDGAFVDDFRLGADTVDMVVLPLGEGAGGERGRLGHKEQLASVPIATPAGSVVPLDTVVEIVPANAPQQIARIEELPAVTVRIRPPQGKAVEELEREIREQLIPAAEQIGLLDRTMRVRLEGTAAELDDVRASLFGRPSGAGFGGWRAGGVAVAGLIGVAGVAAGAWVLFRALTGRGPRRARAGMGPAVYAALGLLLLGATVGGVLGLFFWQPQLLTARFIWALAVTYLLMCALYESFVYPLVIMFSVPLAIVGGFAGLAIVHAVTLADPTKAPQQLDVLTMLGFIILIGIVVNNAILLVEQALNLMEPWRVEEGAGEKPMEPLPAIVESVRTRIRPIFMSALTSVFGTLPLVLAPGAGSEMYRGMGAVLIGGQLCSTLFTLVLVPLVFSMTVQMTAGVRGLVGPSVGGDSEPVGPTARARPEEEPELQTV